MMEQKDCGFIAMVVNEFGGLKGTVKVYADYSIHIMYDTCAHPIRACDLNNLLAVKRKGLESKLYKLTKDKADDAPVSMDEMNLKGRIGHLETIMYKLSELTTLENKQKEEPCS